MMDKYQHKAELNKSKSISFLPPSKKKNLLKKESMEAMLYKVDILY